MCDQFKPADKLLDHLVKALPADTLKKGVDMDIAVFQKPDGVAYVATLNGKTYVGLIPGEADGNG